MPCFLGNAWDYFEMNHFTKEELENIHTSLYGDDSVCRVSDEVMHKIQSMIETDSTHNLYNVGEYAIYIEMLAPPLLVTIIRYLEESKYAVSIDGNVIIVTAEKLRKILWRK